MAKEIFRNSLAVETDLAFVTSKLQEPLAEEVGGPWASSILSGSRSLSQEKDEDLGTAFLSQQPPG